MVAQKIQFQVLWVSILKTYSPNDCIGGMFESQDGNGCSLQRSIPGAQFWLDFDFAFILTGEPTIPDLQCSSSFSWTDVKTGETKSGSFTVENIGEPNSMLDWEIESHPDWGTWTISPESGDDLKPEDEPITISVSVVAPDEKNTEFTGNLSVVNKENASDYESIPISLTTSKNRLYINIPFLRFLEKHPHWFPILRLLLGL